MAQTNTTDPSFQPLDQARAEELTLLVDEAARSNGILLVDPDNGVQGVMPADSVLPEDGLIGLRRFRRHFIQRDTGSLEIRIA